MTQEPEHHEDDVRRLLGAAAHPPPTLPAPVADRLDDVLAGLTTERSGSGHEGAVVTPLRRPGGLRRRWPQVLGAAAAVSVLGLGIGNLAGLQTGQSESASGGQDAATADRSSEGAGESAQEPGLTVETDEHSDQLSDAYADPDQPPSAPTRVSEVRLRTQSLTVDVQRVEDFGLAAAVADGWEGACLRPDVPHASSWLPVRLDGTDAVLVLHPPSDGVRRAEVYTCDDPTTPAATTTVDAR